MSGTGPPSVNFPRNIVREHILMIYSDFVEKKMKKVQGCFFWSCKWNLKNGDIGLLNSTLPVKTKRNYVR